MTLAYDVEQATARNLHTEVAQLVADAIVAELAQIAKRQMDCGYINHRDQQRRDEILSCIRTLYGV